MLPPPLHRESIRDATNTWGVALESVLSPVAASALTALVLKAQGVAGELRTHDRLASYTNEDLARWIRDRDRAAAVRMNEITQDAAAKNVASGGALAQSRGKVYKQVLHEYRDRGLNALRDVDELADQEGRLHVFQRRRDGRTLRRPRLPEDCRAIVQQWRDWAELDVSGPEVEPRLVELERGA